MDHPVDVGLQVFVKLPTGRTLQITVDPTNTCFDLKQKITQQLALRSVQNKERSFAPNQQILSFSSTALDDSSQLCNYNIQQDSTIFVCLKPPSKDILGFDECKSCQRQAIKPCALPCGHSCCKTCVAADATVCPVAGCKSSFNGLSRDTLYPNWIAEQFFDEKETKPKQMCQSCAEDGVNTEATHWCESCSKTGSMEYYCDDCLAAEHAVKSNRAHVRVPIDRIAASSKTSFMECTKHKLPQDLFCLDDHAPLCHRCRDECHKWHDTKLIADCEGILRAHLKAPVAALSNVKALESEQNDCSKSKQQKLDDIKRLEQEIVVIDEKMKVNQEILTKCLLASVVLTKLIDELPQQDLLDIKKHNTMKLRVQQTVKLTGRQEIKQDLPPQVVPYGQPFGSPQFGAPTGQMPQFGGAPSAIPPPQQPLPERVGPFFLKQRYELKATAGSGSLRQPQGIAIEPSTGNIFISDRAYLSIQDFSFLKQFVGQFNYPIGLTFDLTGGLAVSDHNNHRIHILDPSTGQRRYLFGEGQMSYPRGICTDIDGNIVVSESGQNRISVWTVRGALLKSFGAAWLKNPFAVSVDLNNGSFIISDTGHSCLQLFNSAGDYIKTVGPGSQPWGTLVDAKGNFLVADYSNHRIQQFSSSGQFIMALGQIPNPCAVAFDQEGQVLVVEQGNARVRILN